MAILVKNLNQKVRRQIQKQFGERVDNKFNARKVRLDGFTFDSQAESRRYLELLMQKRAKLISGLKVHPEFLFRVEGQKICKFIPDFRYVRDGEEIIEDVKSKPTRTRAYRMKVKLMKAIYGLTVNEIM